MSAVKWHFCSSWIADIYAPFMGIMFSGLCMCLFVRLSRFRLKFLVTVVFDEIEVQST